MSFGDPIVEPQPCGRTLPRFARKPEAAASLSFQTGLFKNGQADMLPQTSPPSADGQIIAKVI